MQRGRSDCGIACLLSMIRLYHGNGSRDELRMLSKSDTHGTSIKGLKRAANQWNLQADAFLVEELTDFKKEATFPCILLIVNRRGQNHFIICCESLKENFFQIFDPAKGFELWNEEHLVSCWKSKVVVIITPKQVFIK